MDRISNLTDDVICHVLYLTAKEPESFKYYENLINIAPVFIFDPLFEKKESFKPFVRRLLTQPETYCVKNFCLKLRSTEFGPSYYNLVNDCLQNVLKRCVLDLELDINVIGDDYPLPLEVFTCESVVKMKLGSGFVIDIVPMNALLPSLKALLLDSVRFYDRGGFAFTKLLSACPVLEELVIDVINWKHWKWSCIVSSLTLKSLAIRCNMDLEENYEASESESLSFDTPNLVYLEYSDVLQHTYPVVILDSLVEAKLSLHREMVRDKKGITNLILGLNNVQNLRLDNIDTAMIFLSFSEVLPEFANMTHLSISTRIEVCWKAILLILKKSPKLKSFTIEALHCGGIINDEDLEPYCECLLGYSFLLSCHIEVIKITQFSGDIREMEQIKHILKKSRFLELLEIHVQRTREDIEARRKMRKRQIMIDLLEFPRASPKCIVEVEFS